MSLFDRFLHIVAPLMCEVCGQNAGPLCSSCLQTLPQPASSCYRCQRATTDSRTCEECWLVVQLQRVQAVTLYDGMAKRLLWQLKSDGTQVAAKTMAYGMSGLLEGNKECLLVPIPTASARIRSRGYDQARLLVGHVSRRSGIPWAACLARHGQAHQVGAGRATRLKQLKTAFRGRLPWLVKGAHIVLIDDVVTTGASFEAAAEVLYGMGAASVEGLAFAQVAASKQKAP